MSELKKKYKGSSKNLGLKIGSVAISFSSKMQWKMILCQKDPSLSLFSHFFFQNKTPFSLAGLGPLLEISQTSKSKTSGRTNNCSWWRARLPRRSCGRASLLPPFKWLQVSVHNYARLRHFEASGRKNKQHMVQLIVSLHQMESAGGVIKQLCHKQHPVEMSSFCPTMFWLATTKSPKNHHSPHQNRNASPLSSMSAK